MEKLVFCFICALSFLGPVASNTAYASGYGYATATAGTNSSNAGNNMPCMSKNNTNMNNMNANNMNANNMNTNNMNANNMNTNNMNTNNMNTNNMNMNFNLSTPQGILAFLNMEGIDPNSLVTTNCIGNGNQCTSGGQSCCLSPVFSCQSGTCRVVPGHVEHIPQIQQIVQTAGVTTQNPIS